MLSAPINLIYYPEPLLLKSCSPIKAFTPEIQRLADQMLELMYARKGVGLAAPQIGHSIQLICIDVSENQSEPIQLINPKILNQEGRVNSVEGCLSIPGFYCSLTRFAQVEVLGESPAGNQRFWAEGLMSICLQHELDHLAGKTLIERLSPFKRARALEKISKLNHRLFNNKVSCKKF